MLLPFRCQEPSRLILLFFALIGIFVFPAFGQSKTTEVASRRARLIEQFPDGLIILPAKWEEKAMEQPFWVQDATFFYFTSLATAPGAILLLDGPSKQSILFSGPDPKSFGVPLPDLNVQNRPDWAEKSGVSAVLPNSEFESYVRSRLKEGISTIYLDGPRRQTPSEVPAGMLEVSGFHRLWQQSIQDTFPDVIIKSVSAAIGEMVWVKSEVEVAQLSQNANFSADALRKGMKGIREGRTQRQVEGEVVAACLQAGAEGPSFWPWVMTGPNAHITRVVRSFFDDTHLNRTFKKGELVRVDVGCTAGGYGGDVGRTVPVSGLFTQEQATIWDILIAGYKAGIQAMKPGQSIDQIKAASINGMTKWGESNPKHAALVTQMSAATGGVGWHIHGVGIESGETAEQVLYAGSVIAFEPGFSTATDAYYLEDMILITDTGSQVLTLNLPYSSIEMHAFLAQ